MVADLSFYVSDINFSAGIGLFLSARSARRSSTPVNTTRYCGNLGDATIICRSKAVIFFQPPFTIGTAVNKSNCFAAVRGGDHVETIVICRRVIFLF